MRRALLAVLVLAAGALGVALLVAEPAAERAFFAAGPPGAWVIAHRGGRALRPENTLAAFEHAAALGVDVLEMDVRATADGQIVVLHDATVDRTTDGRGPVAALKLEALQGLDAGYRWTGDGGRTFAYRGQGIRVPTLAEVFARFPGRRMNIELKPAEPAFAVSVCRLVREHGRQDLVLVASMQDDALAAFREACPEVATSMGPAEGRWFYVAHFVHLARAISPRAAALQAPYLLGGREAITGSLVEAAHARNVRLHAWTVNDEPVMQRLIALGVDGIITDRPDVLLSRLGRLRR